MPRGGVRAGPGRRYHGAVITSLRRGLAATVMAFAALALSSPAQADGDILVVWSDGEVATYPDAGPNPSGTDGGS